MNKSEFLEELCKRLRTFPPEDAERTISFYSEAIDDRIEDGMTEEEAVAALGSLDDIAAEAANTLPLTTLVKGRVEDSKKRASNKGVWITLAVAGSPLWLIFAIALLAISIAALAVVFSVIIVIAAVVISLVVSGVAAIVGGIILPYEGFAPRLILIGAGLVIVGLGLVCLPAAAALGRAVVRLLKRIVKKIKASIAKGKGEAE